MTLEYKMSIKANPEVSVGVQMHRLDLCIVVLVGLLHEGALIKRSLDLLESCVSEDVIRNLCYGRDSDQLSREMLTMFLDNCKHSRNPLQRYTVDYLLQVFLVLRPGK